MSTIPVIITEAAFEAHISLYLSKATGRETSCWRIYCNFGVTYQRNANTPGRNQSGAGVAANASRIDKLAQQFVV